MAEAYSYLLQEQQSDILAAALALINMLQVVLLAYIGATVRYMERVQRDSKRKGGNKNVPGKRRKSGN